MAFKGSGLHVFHRAISFSVGFPSCLCLTSCLTGLSVFGGASGRASDKERFLENHGDRPSGSAEVAVGVTLASGWPPLSLGHSPQSPAEHI